MNLFERNGRTIIDFELEHIIVYRVLRTEIISINENTYKSPNIRNINIILLKVNSSHTNFTNILNLRILRGQ